MSSEKILPTREERDEHFSGEDNAFDRAKVSFAVGATFAAVSIVFAPALPGLLVAALETGRQALKMDSEDTEYHRKYPGLDEKESSFFDF